MLPMALAVSFSRVYNGVHIKRRAAGAIWAGLNCQSAPWAFTLETTADFGKKWFPLCTRKLPSLVPNLKWKFPDWNRRASTFMIPNHDRRQGSASATF